ncbi:MAG: DNA methyltransferase [Candidatus Caldarchaeum sp.]
MQQSGLVGEYVSSAEDLMPAEELGFKPTYAFGKYRCFLEHALEHPAKMNTELLEFLVKRFTKPGDTVLDPMAGSGSTGVVCALHGRNCIQVDVEPRFYTWMEKARENVEKHQMITPKGWIKNVCGDARELNSLLSGKVSHVITSPPYLKTAYKGAGINKRRPRDVRIGCYTIGRTVASPNAVDNLPRYGDIDRLSFNGEGGPTYLSEMLKIYSECFKALKPGGYMAVVVKPFIKDRRVVDLPHHSYLLLSSCGFKLVKLYRLRLRVESFWRIIYHRKNPEVPAIRHEYVLVVQKP